MRPFVNTLTPGNKYSLDNEEMLPRPIQSELSKKLNIFPQVFTTFPKSVFNFEYLEKTTERHNFCIFEILDGETRAYVNV